MIDLDALLEKATAAERTVPVCLDGRLLADLQAAQEAYAEAMNSSLSDVVNEKRADEDLDMVQRVAAKTQDLQAAANAAQDAVRAAQVQFRLRAVPEHEWTSLALKNPPRDGNQGDDEAGVNNDGFTHDLLRASLVDPLCSEEQFERLKAVLHLTEYRKLATAATALSSRQANLVPFSFGASAPTPSSGAKSKRPGSSA